MNITFMIGNGFDLGMGIASRFSDYFPFYEQETQSKVPHIQQFAKNLNNDRDKWSYFELELGKHTRNLGLSNKDEFIEQLKDFQTRFLKYLDKQVDMLDFDNTNKILERMVYALTEFYSKDNLPKESANAIEALFRVKSMEEHQYNFINFNYTPILDKCVESIPNGVVRCRKLNNGYEKNDSIGEIVHVHGVSGNCSIMGVNDESQILNAEFAGDKKFLRYIVKPVINTAIRMAFDTDAENLISQSTIICIYGMSLGDTDKKWWDKVLLWLVNDESHHLIIFEKDSDFTSTTPFERIEKEDKIVEKLTNFSSHGVNAEDYRSRIHIGINKNIFELDLVRENLQQKNVAAMKEKTKGLSIGLV